MRHQEGFTMHNKESDGEEAFYKEILREDFCSTDHVLYFGSTNAKNELRII
jgi:hypothetical protein